MINHTPAKAQLIQSSNAGEDSRKNKHRLLLLSIVLIPACLWLTAQLALLDIGANRVKDTVLSNMAADYSRWQPQQFNPLKPDLIGTIRSDQLTLVALPGVAMLGTIVPFVPFSTGTRAAEVPSQTPTATATRTPTSPSTPTNTPYIPARPSRTPTETGTPWPVTPTDIPTAVPPPVPPLLPVLQFESIAYTITEGGGNVTLRVLLSSASAQEITVSYFTSDGTASAPGDYTSTSGVLIVGPGNTEQTLAVPIMDDLVDESDETLQIALVSPINATLGTANPATVTILDDDPLPPCTGVSGPYTLAAPELQSVDQSVLDIACGQDITIDLESNPISTITASGDFDLVVFELIANATEVYMDWVTVQIGTSSTGPWITVFEWGNGPLDLNTSLGQNGFTPTEPDNAPIPMAPIDPLNPQLLPAPIGPLQTGIGIDVDAFAPPGIYQWLRISSPLGGANDPSQVDYIQILP